MWDAHDAEMSVTITLSDAHGVLERDARQLCPRVLPFQSGELLAQQADLVQVLVGCGEEGHMP